MKHHKIYKAGSEDIIFSGLFLDIKSCVEAAICERICLDYADLRGANLTNAELDEGQFSYARFDQANLTGANMSCANLKGAIFRQATLYNVCFCESVMTNAQFFEVQFGGSDIAWTDISNASFDGYSALDLNFSECLFSNNTKYYDHTGSVCEMTRPPLLIKGLKYPVIFFDRHLKVGPAVWPMETWLRMSIEEMYIRIPADVVQFFLVYQALFFRLAEKRFDGMECNPQRKLA